VQDPEDKGFLTVCSSDDILQYGIYTPNHTKRVAYFQVFTDRCILSPSNHACSIMLLLQLSLRSFLLQLEDHFASFPHLEMRIRCEDSAVYRPYDSDDIRAFRNSKYASGARVDVYDPAISRIRGVACEL
jgi:hypothetical protein